MTINYNGDNYFKIQSGDTVILVDPTNQRSFKGAKAVLYTLPGASTPIAENAPFAVSHQGEYEIGGVHVSGFDVPETTIYRLEMDDLMVVILGHLTKEPGPDVQENLKEADVLILPAGGKPCLSQANAAKLVRQLTPAIVIPALYKNLKPFMQEMEQDKCEPEEKLTVKKKDVKSGAMIVKCLNA